MTAVDVIITLVILIKVIDIFVTRYKKTINEEHEESKTSSIKTPVIIIITIVLIGIAATNQKEDDLKPAQQANANEKPPSTNYPAGIYMQPLLNTTTGIINNMGKKMIENTKRNQREAQRKISKANQ